MHVYQGLTLLIFGIANALFGVCAIFRFTTIAGNANSMACKQYVSVHSRICDGIVCRLR